MTDMDLETRYVTPCQPDSADLEPGVLYLSGGPGCTVDYLHVTLLCPCGCGREVWVGSDPESPPSHCWSIERHEDGTVTVAPSIAFRGGRACCGSHFFIRRSRIVNC